MCTSWTWSTWPAPSLWITLSALIETSGEHRKELIALRAGVQRIERRLHQHHTRLQRLEGVRDDRPTVGVMAAMDAMNGRTFEHHIARLLRRDGCTNVTVQGGHEDRGIDVSGLTADGRRLVVQCKRFAKDFQRFPGAPLLQQPTVYDGDPGLGGDE
ncbi:DUF2034 domain-containing protein [Streptomyces doebereineriae]|uniref:DUF2034 domain-containing protein n=1 Tax=Streptomyces doebereineriae TaxID=3075528 RepID=A0ABU2V3S9_9ACTN|nr:DUF2034 domain-containing protein [Streptomyces sp. DSM 41640]MDT0480212.1 DUF2034 domain-containing protein [Streptomyces sp. DSM 41640]